MNDLIEQKLQEHLKQFADKLKQEAESALGDIYCGLLPYVLHDTAMNAELQAADIVRNIIAGNFEWDGDYIAVNAASEHSTRVRIEFTKHQYDRMRDKIIERMPKCPKDARIAMLEQTIQDMMKSVY